MSTDEIVDLRPSGDGGLDDGADDQEVTPQGVVESIGDEEDEALGGEGEVDGAEDWLAELDDETREAIGAKYKTPAEAARALANAEKLIGTQGKDVGDLREDLAKMAVELEQLRGGQNGAAQEDQIPSYADVAGYAAQVMQKVDAGDVEPGEAMATVLRAFSEVAGAREEAIIKELGKEVAERTAPLDDHKRQTEFAREVTQMRRELGDEAYAEHYQSAADLLEDWGRKDPDFARNPLSIRTAFHQVIANATIAARREAQAGVLEGSGRGPGGRTPVSAAKAIVDEMDQFTSSRRNGGGGL